MLDTQGPEIRTGSFSDGVKEVTLNRNTIVTLTTDPALRNSQIESTKNCIVNVNQLLCLLL